MRILVLIFAAATALASAAPAIAQSKQAPARITPTSATSGCIGSLATPVCAAETLLACLTRNDDGLCRQVGAAPPTRSADAAGPLQVEYTIDRVSVIRPEDVTDDTRDLDWFKPGYTLVEISRRTCPASQANCEDNSWEYVQVYLRPAAGGSSPWQVVNWRGDAEDDTAPEIPDAFQRR